MKKLVSFAAGLAFVAGLSTAAQAQAVTVSGASPLSVNTYVTVVAPSILKLTINDTSTAVTAPVEADFDAGFQDVAGAVTATVKSNKGWTLKIKGGAALWTGTGGARANKPVADLLWGTVSPAATVMTTTDANVAAPSLTGTASSISTINYRILWGYTNDTPGTYSIPVVFTLTTP